jgi:hypothetical protein
MYPEATKDAQFVSDQAKDVVVKVRCVPCTKSGTGGEYQMPHYERQSPRVPEIEGLYLETRKSGGPFHSCNRHKPPLVLIRWHVLRNRPPAVRGSP